MTYENHEVQLNQNNEKAGIVFRKNNNPPHGGFMWIKFAEKRNSLF